MIAIVKPSSDPAQAGADHDEDRVEAQDTADDGGGLPHGRPVVHIEGRGKEGQIADQPQHPGAAALPEGPLPGEDAAVVEKAFDDHRERREHQAVENAVVEPEDLFPGILREHQADRDAHDQEHEGDLDVVADHQQPGRVAHADRRAPDRRVAADEADHRVPDLVEDVHAPEREGAEDDLVVLLVQLLGDDVHRDEQQRYGVPVHGLLRLAQDLQRGLSVFGKAFHICPSLLLQEAQAQRDKELADVVQADVRHAQALARLGAEGVQDQHDVADEEEHRPRGEERREGRWRGEQVCDCDAVEQHDRAEVEHPEDLEGRLCGNPPEDPDHQQRREHRPDHTAQPRLRAQRQDGCEVEHVPAEKNQDADKKDQLALFLEYPAQIEQHVRDAAEHQPGHDEAAQLRPGRAQRAEGDEAERGQALERHGGDVFFLPLLPEEDAGEDEAQGDQQEHASTILSELFTAAAAAVRGVFTGIFYHRRGGASIASPPPA